MTVSSSRPAEMYPGGVAAAPAATPAVPGTGTASPTVGAPVPPASPLPVPSASTPGLDQLLDEATRAVSYGAGAPFVWM